MDKNTLIGLLLIGAVLMGFTLCRRNDDLKNSKEKTEQTQAASDKAKTASAEAPTTVGVDSTLRDNAIASVRNYGSRDNENTHTLTVAGVKLSVDSTGTLSGTVTAGNRTMPVEAVLNPADQSLDPAARANGAAVLRDALDQAGKYRAFASFMDGENKEIVLKNDRLEVTFSSLGGKVSKVVLPGYKTETTSPATDICLFDAKTGGYEFEFETENQRIATGQLYFQSNQVNDSVVEMSLPLEGGAVMTLRYTVIPAEYLVKMELLQKGMENIVPLNRSSMRLRWQQTLRRNETGRTFEERNSAIYYKFDNESPDDLSANGDDDETLSGNLKWVAFKNQFFSSVLIAGSHLATADVASKVIKNTNMLKTMNMDATFDYSSDKENPASFMFYFGPNDYPLLSSLDEKLASFAGEEGSDDADLQLNKLVPLGWGIFGWINRFVVIPVFSFLSRYISNYGIIILILTLLVKLVLFPLTFKSYMSQAKMRVLAPEIKEINDKYPGQENAMKRQQETMKLYSRAGASPFSGCLPMLLQMPILIAMFAFFPSAIELRGQSFLWVHDLSAPDFMINLPFAIPFLGNRLSLFCLLMTAVNIIYTRINMQNQPTSSSMPGMKWMMYLMPLMFLFFFNDYAAGLSYYYFLSLLITIVQTYAFRLFVNEDKVRAEMLANAKKPRKKSGWMAKLEEAQRKQEAMMREQNRRKR